MPFGTLQLKPGVNTVQTPTLNQMGISTSSLIRFRDGLIEKLGGWQNYAGTAMDSTTRALHAWQDLSQNKWLAMGNTNSLVVLQNGATQSTLTPQQITSNVSPNFQTTQGTATVVVTDANINNLTQYDTAFFVTPVSVGGIILAGAESLDSASGTTYHITADTYATSSVGAGGVVPQFTTTAGSNTVTVTFANHGLITGNSFAVNIPTIVGGITLSGVYSNVVLISSSQFTINALSVATSSATVSMNGGNARIIYGITVTQNSGQVRSGAPPGPIGMFAIGEGYSVLTTVTNQTGTALTNIQDWSMDNWGEVLLACPRGGMIYYWPPNQAFQTMIPLGEGPVYSNGIFVAMPQQILVAWGSVNTIELGTTDAVQDPLIVRWSDQLDYTKWDVNITTQAGSFHIPRGSEIRGGIQGATQAYIFTDIDCWAMQYLGPPFVFGFNQVGTECGLVGQHAVCNLYGKTYWMNDSNFFQIGAGSGVEEIPCPVWDTVFQDLDTANASKCVAGANSQFNEVWFYYPSKQDGTGENSRYAKYNVTQNVWDVGVLDRSAWIDRSILGGPMGASPTTKKVYQHETGYSNDGAAMDSYFETGYTAYGDGENFSVIDYFEPDMKWNTVGSATEASVSATLTAVPSPNGTAMTVGPQTMTNTTTYLTPRLRGRQIKWRMETNDSTSWWRIGSVRYRFSVDGRR